MAIGVLRAYTFASAPVPTVDLAKAQIWGLSQRWYSSKGKLAVSCAELEQNWQSKSNPKI